MRLEETLKISIIIPALNEAAVLAETLRCARQPGVHEIIVADGGSSDETCSLAESLADSVIRCERGRATQMNAGAERASGDVLLFLHADTLLPKGFAEPVTRACDDPGGAGGRFDITLAPSSPLLWLTGELINRRSRLTRIATGDQAIFVRREVFERLGGYAPIPLMEDVDFSRRLKRAGKVACLRQRVVTSSRRWREHGVLRTILLMWSLRALYFLGVSPQRLRQMYVDAR